MKHRFATDSYGLVVNDLVAARGSAERLRRLAKAARSQGDKAHVFLGDLAIGESWSESQAAGLAAEKERAGEAQHSPG
jgi:hypothetical protein